MTEIINGHHLIYFMLHEEAIRIPNKSNISMSKDELPCVNFTIYSN